MRTLIFLIPLLSMSAVCCAQKHNPAYDSLLAKKLQADDFGMRYYVLVILKTGPNTTTDKAFADSCFKSHMANMDKMVKQGKLCVAGPIKKNDRAYRGIFILNVKDFQEAALLLNNDAAIRSGLLEPEMYSWYGSAALPEYLDESDKVWKQRY